MGYMQNTYTHKNNKKFLFGSVFYYRSLFQLRTVKGKEGEKLCSSKVLRNTESSEANEAQHNTTNYLSGHRKLPFQEKLLKCV